MCFLGYRLAAPSTTFGKIFLVFFGVIGCAAAILFFNLFLQCVPNFVAQWLMVKVQIVEKKAKSWYFSSHHTTRWHSEWAGGLEAFCLPCSTYFGDSLVFSGRYCIRTLLRCRRLELSGVSVLLLRDLQHYGLWGHGERPARALWSKLFLPNCQYLNYLFWRLLYLLFLEHHCYYNQSNVKLDLGQSAMFELPQTLFNHCQLF